MLERVGEALRNVLPLGNGGKAIVALAILVGAFLLFLALQARSAEPEMERAVTQVAVGRAIVRGHTAAMNLAWSWPAAQSRRDVWVASMTLIGASDFYGVHAPNNFALDAQYVTGYRHFDLGLGISWMENPEPYNGSHINFALSAGYRFQRWPLTLFWKHYSCGGTCAPNLGRDMAFLGYRF